MAFKQICTQGLTRKHKCSIFQDALTHALARLQRGKGDSVLRIALVCCASRLMKCGVKDGDYPDKLAFDLRG